ncbi:hypothetical protein [Nesterenkonia alkaliphila]|uniref:Uncharacterized protein n=1 Tax=Nesterenkonia alkaliphila TaxID=1463631 RepID=A0A7K1UK79_9MICC|nr:hypothetical protein [Nesterenkonia alkaliphila]MVT26879.1 hypothetical protein [Nesterenkonia alkaliphila]GFZ82234.1 hypothetical protein GCM10011359_08610 [Nesterenkonia alkaliphila]
MERVIGSVGAAAAVLALAACSGDGGEHDDARPESETADTEDVAVVEADR